MGDDSGLIVADIDRRLEDLDPKASDLRSAKTAKELLSLTAEHRPTDHLDTSPYTGQTRLKGV